MQTLGSTEVTGVVHVNSRRQFLAVGWNRKITAFDDKSDVRCVLYREVSFTGTVDI